MSNSNIDFLEKMLEAGKKYSGGSGQGIVGRVLIEFGLHRYVAGHEFWSFWKAVPNDSEIDIIGEELIARLQKAGCADRPVFGFKVTIKADVLSRDEPYKSDLMEFIPEWQEDGFNLVLDSVRENNLPINKIFFGRVLYKANPHFVKKGEAGKTEVDQDGNPRYPSVRVPTEKFSDKAGALAAIGKGGDSQQVDNSQWSDMARETFGNDMKALHNSMEEISNWYKQVMGGDAMMGYPLPQPLTPLSVKRQIADAYSIETSDVDIALNTPPF